MLDLTAGVLAGGILAHVTTKVTGGVTVTREDESSTPTRQVWRVERTVEDPAELKSAQDLRTELRNAFTRVCKVTKFGLYCPIDRRDVLTALYLDGQQRARAFNADARTTSIEISMLALEIRPGDPQAIAAVAREVADLTRAMELALRAADVQELRVVCNATVALQSMLADDPQLTTAVREMRRAARRMAREIKTTGEVAASTLVELTASALAPVRLARYAYDDTADAADAELQVIAATAPTRFAFDADADSDAVYDDV